jgi:hypothetical protein
MLIVENGSNYSSAFHSIASSVRATSCPVLGTDDFLDPDQQHTPPLVRRGSRASVERPKRG